MIAFAALVAAGTGAGAWLMARPRTLGSCQSAVAPPSGQISVIVPARDEATTLPVLLASIAQLECPPCEVIVVDDGSQDGTARVAAAFGATVIRAPEPAVGWLGKPWACHLGAAAASGSYLCFVDADVELARDALVRLHSAHARYGGLVSVQPHHQTVRVYEELSAYCNIVALMASRMCVLHEENLDVAFGACLFTRADDYEDVGGHAAVRGEVAEDVELSHRYRNVGLAVRAYTGGDTVRFRMYPHGLAQLFEGWSKNLASGARSANPTAVLLATLWVTANVAVATRLAIDGSRRLQGERRLPATTVIASAITILQLRRFAKRAGTFRWYTAVAFPVPLAVFVGICARSLVWTFVRREVTWRGRTIALSTNRR